MHATMEEALAAVPFPGSIEVPPPDLNLVPNHHDEDWAKARGGCHFVPIEHVTFAQLERSIRLLHNELLIHERKLKRLYAIAKHMRQYGAEPDTTVEDVSVTMALAERAREATSA